METISPPESTKSDHRSESFEDDANDKLDVQTLDDALELKSASGSHKV